MFNETEIKGPARAPFDVSSLLEGDLQALDDRGARPLPSTPLRRTLPVRDSAAAGAQSGDAPAMAAPAAEEGAPPAERDPLLETRQTTHGNFEDNAIISQAIKDLLRSSPGWNALSMIERESMDMIALKFSRILSGKSMSKQHWEDVVGYGKLVEEKCF